MVEKMIEERGGIMDRVVSKITFILLLAISFLVGGIYKEYRPYFTKVKVPQLLDETYFLDFPSDWGHRNETLYVNKDILDELNDVYLNTSFEFSACILGDESYLHSLYNIRSGNSTNEAPETLSLLYDGYKIISYCNLPNTVGIIHSHPSKTCQLSHKDTIVHYLTFINDINVKYTAIICGENKLMVYSEDDYYKNYKINLTGGDLDGNENLVSESG